MGSGILLNCKDFNCKIYVCLFCIDYLYLNNKEYRVIRVFWCDNFGWGLFKFKKVGIL